MDLYVDHQALPVSSPYTAHISSTNWPQTPHLNKSGQDSESKLTKVYMSYIQLIKVSIIKLVDSLLKLILKYFIYSQYKHKVIRECLNQSLLVLFAHRTFKELFQEK